MRSDASTTIVTPAARSGSLRVSQNGCPARTVSVFPFGRDIVTSTVCLRAVALPSSFNLITRAKGGAAPGHFEARSVSVPPPRTLNRPSSLTCAAVAINAYSSSIVGRGCDHVVATDKLPLTAYHSILRSILGQNTAAYRRASRTRWPNSGRISFSMASRTPAGEPGIVSTTVLSTSPPTARLSIAAGPIA